MFEKVCHGDNLFSVSYRKELRKSFLVPDFTIAMSLAWIWYVNRKRISRRINLYTAHLPHFYEFINNKFSNICKTLIGFDNGILINWKKSQIKAEKHAGESLFLFFRSKCINSVTFQQVPLIVFKIAWGVSHDRVSWWKPLLYKTYTDISNIPNLL